MKATAYAILCREWQIALKECMEHFETLHTMVKSRCTEITEEGVKAVDSGNCPIVSFG